MNLHSEIALLALRAIPPTLQTRILNSPAFLQAIKMNGLNAPFRVAGRILFGDLMDGIRKAYDTGKPVLLVNLDEQKVTIKITEGLASASLETDATPEAGATEGIHVDFLLVAPDAAIRTSAFEQLQRDYGLTGPGTHWRSVVAERPLTNEELIKIHRELAASLPHWFDRLQQLMGTQELTPDQFVPQSIDFFTALCGPAPSPDMDAKEYFSEIVAKHDRGLISQDVGAALHLILPRSFYQGRNVDKLIENVSDSDILEAIGDLDAWTDPFSLYGILEIAIARRSNPILDQLCLRIVQKLCSEKLERKDEVNIYSFYPALVRLSVWRFRHIEGVGKLPIYWHWYCALTYAAVALRFLEDHQFEANKLSDWLERGKRASDSIYDMLAIRDYPSWRLDHVTDGELRAEVLGRVSSLVQKEESAGRQFPGKALLEEAIKSAHNNGHFIFQPGPLEGHLRPMCQGADRLLPDERLSDLMEGLTKDEFNWAGAAELSLVLQFQPELVNSLRTAIGRIELSGDSFTERTNPLAYAALIAALHKDEAIASANADRILKESRAIAQSDVESSQVAFMLLLMTSGALPDDSWSEWLAERLIHLANILPAGEPLARLVGLIGELKSLLPVNQWRFGRAEAICRISA